MDKLLSKTSWALSVSILGAPAAPKYIELPGIRCAERVDDYPLGHVGGVWTEYLHRAAENHCGKDSSCAGFMRYIGPSDINPIHCRGWCGRPQLCAVGRIETNKLWLSYIKEDELPNLDLPSVLGDEELFRELSCHTTGQRSKARVMLFSEPAARRLDIGREAEHGQEDVLDICRVLHIPFGLPSLVPELGAKPFDSRTWFDGILIGSEQEDLPFFSATRPQRGPWQFFVDAHSDYPAPILGSPGVKRQFMSVYFLSMESTCPGPEGTHLTVHEASNMFEEHVYVDEGTHESRKAAFEEYQVSILCGDFSRVPFPPLALVYSLAYASHALVPSSLHGNLSRIFHHLPDGAQPYKNVHIEKFYSIMQNMFNDPDKEELIHYKQTFMFLGQQLFYYRYREPARKRIESSACALCEQRARKELRAVEKKGAEANVAYVFCSMSRRSAHRLRQSVRETWGQLVGSAQGAVQKFFVGFGDDALSDKERADVVELPVVESYRTINVKAFAMLEWAFDTFPNFEWLVRHDDDVYLRPQVLLSQLTKRPPIRYLWGNIDHGSSPVREPEHQHYNTYKQCPKRNHPVWGDIFPPYARGHLWAMSADLVGEIVKKWKEDLEDQPEVGIFTEAVAEQLPHPDDPALGIVIANLVTDGYSINLDDRDFNMFSLNPSCNSTFSNIHNRTLVVHHVGSDTMHCMWKIDRSSNLELWSSRGFPDLCPCGSYVEEEEDLMYSESHGIPFTYDRLRFNTWDVDLR